MYVTKHIDWLSVTFPSGTSIRQLFPDYRWIYVGRGLHGYKHAYTSPSLRATFQEGGHAEEMGCHLQLTGEALASLRLSVGYQDDMLATYLAERDGLASRIDLTLNIHEGKITPATMWKAFKAGQLTARAKTARFIEGIDDGISGDTFYLGSPKSDRQFRGYNKAAEQGITDGSAWLRLELELRNLRAKAAFQSCIGNGVAETVTGHVEDFIHWDNGEFKQALTGVSAPPHDLPRKDTNRQRWLLGQVAIALAKEVNLDLQFRYRFDLAVESALEELNQRG